MGSKSRTNDTYVVMLSPPTSNKCCESYHSSVWHVYNLSSKKAKARYYWNILNFVYIYTCLITLVRISIGEFLNFIEKRGPSCYNCNNRRHYHHYSIVWCQSLWWSWDFHVGHTTSPWNHFLSWRPRRHYRYGPTQFRCTWSDVGREGSGRKLALKVVWVWEVMKVLHRRRHWLEILIGHQLRFRSRHCRPKKTWWRWLIQI